MNPDSTLPKEVKNLLTDLELGLKYKKQHSSCDKWADYRNYYRGKFPDDANNEVVLNRIFSYVKSMVPRVYFRNPGVLASAKRPEYVGHARVMEAIDNNLIDETNLKRYLKKAVLDASLCGTGALKLGYDSEFGHDTKQAYDQDEGTVTQVSAKDGRRIEYNSDIKPGMPFALRAMPDQIITPFGYADSHDLPWVAEMVLRPVEDIKHDAKYSKKQRNLIQGGFSVPNDASNMFSAFSEGGDKGRFALMYEIRDWRTGQFYTLCENRVLYQGEDNLQIESLPWEFVIFNEDPEHFWGLSDVEMVMGQQFELNEIRSHARRMRRLELLKFIYASKAFKPEDLQRLLSADPLDMGIGIECQAEHLAASVFEFKPNSNTDGLIREQEQTDSDFRDTLGFSQNQMGNFVPFHNKTAKEAGIVDQAASIRSDERRDCIADVLSNIVRKWNQYIIKYWDTPRVVEIVGNDGYKYWIKYSGKDLTSEVTLNIQPEEGMPISREIRHQTAGELFQMLREDPLIDQIGLRRLLLQQTDIIDPAYTGLLKPPQPNPNMNVGPNNPMSMQDLQSQTQPGQALGKQPNPTGGGNAPV